MSPTKLKKVPGEQTGEKVSAEPPYKVILHNNWISETGRIVYVLKKCILGMTIKKATNIMWTAHTEGRAAGWC